MSLSSSESRTALCDRFIDEDLLSEAVTALLRPLLRVEAEVFARRIEAAGVVARLVPGVS
jgi:hypothetical protein